MPRAISELLDYISQDAPRQVPLGASGKVSCETLRVELRPPPLGAGRRRTPGASDDALPPGVGAESPCGEFESRLLTLTTSP